MVGAAALLGIAAGGWWFFGRDAGGVLRAKSGQLAVRWRGKYPGTMTLPATLNWCPVTRVGVLEAVSGDSGAALVLYERDSLSAGPHLVVSPDLSASASKPGASFVIRWVRMRPDTAVAGFRSESGTVRIQFAAGLATGDINARMRAANGSDTLVVQGVFTAVPVVATAKGCT